MLVFEQVNHVYVSWYSGFLCWHTSKLHTHKIQFFCPFLSFYPPLPFHLSLSVLFSRSPRFKLVSYGICGVVNDIHNICSLSISYLAYYVLFPAPFFHTVSTCSDLWKKPTEILWATIYLAAFNSEVDRKKIFNFFTWTLWRRRISLWRTMKCR